MGAGAGGSRPIGVRHWRERLADGIRYHEFVQYVFDVQWRELRASCQEKGILLIGDLPIFRRARQR